MIIEETTDKELIKSILCHPEIYGCISSDRCPKAEVFEPPIAPNIQYVAGFVENAIIGLMIYHVVLGKLKCHIQVLPKFRNKFAQKFARMAFNFGKAKNAIIYAEIPDCYPNVLKFSQKLGFIKTGSIENGHNINGSFYDVAILRLENGVCKGRI